MNKQSDAPPVQRQPVRDREEVTKSPWRPQIVLPLIIVCAALLVGVSPTLAIIVGVVGLLIAGAVAFRSDTHSQPDQP